MSRSYIDLRRGRLRVWLDGDGTIGHSETPDRPNRMAIMRDVRSRLNQLERRVTICKRFLGAAKAGRWQGENYRL